MTDLICPLCKNPILDGDTVINRHGLTFHAGCGEGSQVWPVVMESLHQRIAALESKAKAKPTTPTSESDTPTQHQSVPVDEQPAQQGDDATVAAMDDAYQPVCSVSVDEMPQHRRGLRAILAAIHRGEVPGVHDGIPRIIGYDDAMREKDAEIAALRARVAELEHPAEPGDDAAVYRLAEAICALRSFNGDENGREAAKAFSVVRDLLDSRNNTITTLRAQVERLKARQGATQARRVHQYEDQGELT